MGEVYKDNIHPLKNIVKLQKSGIATGIYSACTSNELVLEAIMKRTLKDDDYVLIEATANQVNQYGGYTGMKPADFRDFVYAIANKTGFPKHKIILGGDHLGPLTWKALSADKAMEEAKELVKQFVAAGFTKIHIDTSMHLGSDNPTEKLDTAVIAERGAALAEAAEAAYLKLNATLPESTHPVYVIGSEVPIPGGSQDAGGKPQVTRVQDLEDTVEAFRETFFRRNLSTAWRNVIAVVVQLGIEFGDESVNEYDKNAVKALCSALSNYPDFVFEGHSTDYQTAKALREMVADGIAILKVGPALTFALREGLFALNCIETELLKGRSDLRPSRFIDILEEVMLKYTENWKRYYVGCESKQRLSRKYSFSDRCRYYLPALEVKNALQIMINNLKAVKIPLTLISQYLPIQYRKIRNGQIENNPDDLVIDKVINCIDEYIYGINKIK